MAVSGARNFRPGLCPRLGGGKSLRARPIRVFRWVTILSGRLRVTDVRALGPPDIDIGLRQLASATMDLLAHLSVASRG